MKNRFHIILAVVMLLMPGSVLYAQTLSNSVSASTFGDFIGKIIDVLMQVGAIILTVMLFYSGYLFVVAQGNEEGLERAKSAFKWTLVGGAMLLGSGAVYVVISGTVNAITQ